jgi:hypothetical protein
MKLLASFVQSASIKTELQILDELIHEFESANFGCHFGFWYVGVLASADDSLLLAPSANVTRTLLTICDDYGERYSNTFNTINKSK